MKILLLGSGGREHALAWKLTQSPRLTELVVAPGNPGTASLPRTRNVPIAADDAVQVMNLAREAGTELVIIGPEAPLAAGLANYLRHAGLKVFGPNRNAAEIETSKAFAKAFMARHNLPTARYAAFTDFHAAIGHLLTVGYPVVVKASGLAAGKGVVVPTCADEAEAAVRDMLLNRAFGAAGDEVIIEERLEGEEVSLLAFTDGVTVRAMPPAQDHKRVGEGDTGPNTGGMGAYAPAPVCPPALAEELTRTILQPAVDGLRAEGRPFVGVLYAGLMLTATGPKLLEFNCRFGDPETQALLPLLDTDLVEVAEACATGQLHTLEVRWRPGAAACVVLASAGYPGAYTSGHPITGLDEPLTHAHIFHAGTRHAADGRTLTAGGRVLAVTGWGDTLSAALDHAYAGVRALHFEGAHYRRDIAHRALSR